MDSLFLLITVGVMIVFVCFVGIFYITYLAWKSSLDCEDYPVEHELED